ncbi:MAG TPA: hypothetical protein ENI03_03110, partial [Thermodesulfobacterium geofontis]|nr:hypothetical protein [Thermodesulfobacterium geofontis]
MSTLKKLAEKGVITEEMKICAEAEGLEAEYIREGIAKGYIVI